MRRSAAAAGAPQGGVGQRPRTGSGGGAGDRAYTPPPPDTDPVAYNRLKEAERAWERRVRELASTRRSLLAPTAEAAEIEERRRREAARLTALVEDEMVARIELVSARQEVESLEDEHDTRAFNQTMRDIFMPSSLLSGGRESPPPSTQQPLSFDPFNPQDVQWHESKKPSVFDEPRAAAAAPAAGDESAEKRLAAARSRLAEAERGLERIRKRRPLLESESAALDARAADLERNVAVKLQRTTAALQSARETLRRIQDGGLHPPYPDADDPFGMLE